MSWVSSTSISILFNSAVLEPFLPLRGIRQGDPLSPYLFILWMEVLDRIIDEKCTTKEWKPIKASNSGLAISRLFFVNDLLLLAREDITNCRSVRDAIDEFCMKSGHIVNPAKSKIYFFPNVERDHRMEFCDILGFWSIANLGTYLGFPLKALFVLTSNWFRKWFSRKVGVWLLLQIWSNWKAFLVDWKI